MSRHTHLWGIWVYSFKGHEVNRWEYANHQWWPFGEWNAAPYAPGLPMFPLVFTFWRRDLKPIIKRLREAGYECVARKAEMPVPIERKRP